MLMLLKRAFSLLKWKLFVCRLWRSPRYFSNKQTQSRQDTIRRRKSSRKRINKKKTFAYLKLHVSALKMLLFDFEPKSKGRLLQAFTSQYQSFVLSDVFRANVLSIDEPCQFHSWLWFARCAVDINSIVDLIASSSAWYHRILFGQH